MTGRLAVVFGGSGFIGRNVVRELAKRGWRVRVAVRRPHLAPYLKPMGYVGQIQLAQANIRDRSSIERALDGADAVVNLVGVLSQSGKQRFAGLHEAGAGAVADLAAKAGVRRLIHVSAIGADAASPSLYCRTKAAGEAAVREAFPAATIMRPSVVFGPEDDFFNKFARMALFSPALPLIGGGHTRFQPVYVDDVADAICEALARPETAGRTFELGGPSVYTFRDLMKILLKTTWRKRILAPVPFAFAPLIGLVGEIVGLAPFFRPPITRDQVRMLKHDNVVGASGDEGVGVIRDLGISPASVEMILPAYMVRFRKYGQFAERTA